MVNSIKKKVLLFLVHIYRYFEGKSAEYYIEEQKKQCVAGEHTQFYATTIVSDSHSKRENIRVGDYSYIKGELITLGHGGEIIIGNDSYVGPNTYIWSGKRISIGNRVLISSNCCIFDNDIHPINAETRHRQFLEIVSTGQPEWVTLNDKEIVIEDDVWIGANVVILKGVRIGKGAIIGAGSVVTHDIPPYAIAHGNPAKISRVVENFT